jgi:DNA-binding XRE family transcriptional regulator
MNMVGEDAAGTDATGTGATGTGAAGERAAGQEPALERADIPPEVAALVGKRRWSLARAWREHLGLTREEVAGRMGISPAAVAQMEAGSARPRMATLRKIATALGVEAEQLRA